jgi:hypothetical protein
MRCIYRFAVKSRVKLDSAIWFSHAGLTFSLIPNDGRLTELVVEAKGVVFPFLPNVQTQPAVKIPVISVPTDPMFAKVESEIRGLRGALAVWGIFDIDTDYPKTKWEPESPEEKAGTDVYGVSWTRTPPEKAPVFQQPSDLLVRCVLSRRRFEPYEIPMEFFRRGQQDCYDENFIEAIYDLFFVLEFLFAEGTFKTSSVAEKFEGQEKLKNAIAHAQADPLPELQELPLKPQYEQKYARRPVGEVIRAIIELRGYLHHQSLTRKTNWNPAVQKEFKTDALFLLRICHAVVMDICLDVLFDDKEIAVFKSTDVFTEGGKRINWIPIP